jgi:hypothetical protein
MKRWNVHYGPDGEVWKIYQGSQSFLGAPPSTLRYITDGNHFYCDAIDELGALARFVEAWEKRKAKEQANA